MKTFQAFSTILLLLFIFELSAANKIVTQPADTFVKSGSTGYLNCTFDIPATGCYWTKGGTPISIEQRYTYNGNLDTGDCSISITNSQIEHDDGRWRCGMPHTSEMDALTSNEAKYSVIIKPEDPTMWKNENEQLLNKSNLAIVNDQIPINITCQSLNGNPPAKLKFRLGYANIELPGEYSISNGSSPKAISVELFVTLPTNGTYNLDNEVLVCIAEHPAYGYNGSSSYGKRFTYAFTGTLHAPTNTIADVINFDSNDIVVSPGFSVDLSCSASSFLSINYKWTKSSDGESWQDYETGENITFEAFQTRLRCEATAHDDSVYSNASYSNIITITLTSSSSAQTGTIVAIVVVCIVLVVAMVAAVYGLYKKKMLCFKVSKKDEELSENTGNLSAAYAKDLKPGDLTNSEQAKNLLQENANPEETKPIIYADLQLQSPTNPNPPERIATEYASVKRPYGIQ